MNSIAVQCVMQQTVSVSSSGHITRYFPPATELAFHYKSQWSRGGCRCKMGDIMRDDNTTLVPITPHAPAMAAAQDHTVW